ncbi:hypothetical protein EU513_00415 [Yimella sp. RIT 621]|uniref:hypothetical protein n=1 Tax=Yimella sp. RIT 621 TaxID=2510323 RepID=UPI00101D9A78|nr:hypothetical protein [Yimella sp. RIT 621]RYG78808.1 hypothetical protein EU513_00415 [Yimella sp. RIT 621]
MDAEGHLHANIQLFTEGANLEVALGDFPSILIQPSDDQRGDESSLSLDVALSQLTIEEAVGILRDLADAMENAEAVSSGSGQQGASESAESTEG